MSNTMAVMIDPNNPRSLVVERYFVKDGSDPLQLVSWDSSDAEIKDHRTGEISFKQDGVEHPTHLNQNQVNIVAHHYLRTTEGGRETSLAQAYCRVAKTISSWGFERTADDPTSDGKIRTRKSIHGRTPYPGEHVVDPLGMEDDYRVQAFCDSESRKTFEDELLYILASGRAAFNSPVWYNVGVSKEPQCSACFILSLDDSMSGIRSWIEQESKIFQGGSGSGLNISALRGSVEFISGTPNRSSGPMEFMRWADAGAGAIKSGGKTRRAAKMVVMNVNHPDIIDFITSKKEAEDMARALKAQGYSGGMTGDIYKNLPFQNANISVRVTDEFMYAVENDLWCGLETRTDRWDKERRTLISKDGTKTVGPQVFASIKEFYPSDNVCTILPARMLWKMITDCAWDCGDPGIQFDTTINNWNTAAGIGRINASNPCSEFMFLDDTSCNLASINLLKFLNADGSFDVDSYVHTVRIMIVAQELLVNNASYPSEDIRKGTHDSRPLGIGHANLGALIMSMGLPYDSDAARYVAASITCAMSGVGYETSAMLGDVLGPCEFFKKDPDSMCKVLGLHKDRAAGLLRDFPGHENAPLWTKKLVGLGFEGFSTAKDAPAIRNSQISVMAPTGTISFIMGCDTTGIEPGVSLVSYKNLVGGGTLKQTLGCASAALRALGYDDVTIGELELGVETGEDLQLMLIENGAAEKEVSVFDCALESGAGRSIAPMGHVKMMAAIQPFVSGAISKTVNCPSDWTKDQIADLYMESWKLGIKALAVYRDGCKTAQPITTKREEHGGAKSLVREPLQMVRHNTSQIKIDIGYGQFTFYVFIGRNDEGDPQEIFLVGKDGSTLGGMLGGLGRIMSIALQHGVPLKAILTTLAYSAFEPAGMTDHDVVKFVKSPLDAFARILAVEEQILLPGGDWSKIGPNGSAEIMTEKPESSFDGVMCTSCGSSNMTRNGSCYRCENCGDSTGCG